MKIADRPDRSVPRTFRTTAPGSSGHTPPDQMMILVPIFSRANGVDQLNRPNGGRMYFGSVPSNFPMAADASSVSFKTSASVSSVSSTCEYVWPPITWPSASTRSAKGLWAWRAMLKNVA